MRLRSSLMLRSFWCSLCVMLGLALAQPAAQLGGMTYQIPNGWVGKVEGGTLWLKPRDLPAGALVDLQFIPPVKLSGSLADWFAAHVQNNVRDLTGAKWSPPEGKANQSGDAVLQTVVKGQAAGKPVYRYVMGVQHSGQVLAVHFTASSADLLSQYQSGLLAMLDSLKWTGTATPTASSAPPRSSSPAPTATASPASTGSSAKPSSAPGMSALAFIRAGHDPTRELIPDEFRCYPDIKGDHFSQPTLTLTFLPGNGYRLNTGNSQSSGTYRIQKEHYNFYYVYWQSGVLADQDEQFIRFDNYGQAIDLRLERDDRSASFHCYQRGPREDYARIKYALKTPKPGKYACSDKRVLELLPNKAYRLSGQVGQYSADVLGTSRYDFSDLEFTGGPLDGQFGTYLEEGSGQRWVSLGKNLKCGAQGQPTPIPRFGTLKAPSPPSGAGGLEGVFASWQVDTANVCGGVCWDFYAFTKNGYVYTQEPEESLDEANCSRTYPNGLPVCQVYTFKNGRLQIGNSQPRPLVKQPDGTYLFDGTKWLSVRPVTGLKLKGNYRSFSAFGNASSLGNGFSDRRLNFSPDGRFTREVSGGYSSTFTDTGTASGTVTGGVTTQQSNQNSGTYRFVGNTLELHYNGGQVVRLFAFVGEETRGQPNKPALLRLGGSNYTSQDGK